MRTCTHTYTIKVTPDKSPEGVPKPAKGTSAEEWVPRGHTTPKPTTKADDPVVEDMDVDAAEENAEAEAKGGGGEGLDGDGDGDAMDEEEEGKRGSEESVPTALVAVMTNRNGCKLLLRLLAPDHTG